MQNTGPFSIRPFKLSYVLLFWTCLALAAGNYHDFLSALAKRESSGNGRVVNSAGYAGLFQMGESALIDAGYYRRDGTEANDWRGGWTGKNGVNSLNDFLNNSAVQNQAIATYHDKLWGYIQSEGLDNKIGQTYRGVPITQSGLIAAAHLIGAGGLRSCLNGGKCTDGNNTTAFSYMSRFGGFNIANITGSNPASNNLFGNNAGNSLPHPQYEPNASTHVDTPFTTLNPVSSGTAFAGSAGVPMNAVRTVVLGILTVSVLLWSAWVCLSAYSSWRNGNTQLMGMQTNVVSSLVLVSVVTFIALS